MKKLMIAAAVICLAFASQAAVYVTWQTGAIYAANADGTLGSQIANNTLGSVYWATIAFATDSAMQNAVTLSAGDAVSSAAKYATKNATGFSTATGSDFDTAGGPTYYAQVVLHTTVNGVEQTMTSDVGAFTFADGALSSKTLNFVKGTGFDTSANLFSGKTWTPASAPVPEPTSGLLMLVGLGALALRRRRA